MKLAMFRSAPLAKPKAFETVELPQTFPRGQNPRLVRRAYDSSKLGARCPLMEYGSVLSEVRGREFFPFFHRIPSGPHSASAVLHARPSERSEANRSAMLALCVINFLLNHSELARFSLSLMCALLSTQRGRFDVPVIKVADCKVSAFPTTSRYAWMRLRLLECIGCS